ncbi:MAG TPA: VOC family protein [Bacteroidia bacterium]|jgi:predicted enzyme related to lactoylglutathione lyase|nr:VOC family protein [Bacteroidia bacterium]
MKLSNIRLLVTDFDACFKFYKTTLGLHCSYGNLGDNFASFDIGLEGGLCIFKAELMNGAIHKKTTAAKNATDQFAIIIEVTDVDKTTISLQKKKVKFINEPQDMPVWGIRVAHFRDPEGNLIELYSNLK